MPGSTHSTVCTFRFLMQACIILALAITAPSSALPQRTPAAGGEPDLSFGVAGKVTTDFFGFPDAGRALLLQPDGKIIVGGAASRNKNVFCFALARYEGDGSLDASFGSAGKVVTDALGSGSIFTLALLPGGKILAAGSTAGQGDDFAMACYNHDGSLDRNFGAGGIVVTDFGSSELAFDMTIQPDGKILLAGSAGRGNAPCSSLVVARYEKTGRLDSSFGKGGKATIEFSGCGYDRVNAIALQPDGKIIVAGRADENSERSPGVISRLKSDGSVDTTFGGSGKVTLNFLGHQNQLNAIAGQPDGKAVVAGWAGRGAGLPNVLALARYNSDGRLDASFGKDGMITNDFSGRGGEARAIALQSDGAIVVAGLAGSLKAARPQVDFALQRYRSDGSLDTSFGKSGSATTDFSDVIDWADAIAIQQDGKIVLAGYTGDEQSRGDFAIARYK